MQSAEIAADLDRENNSQPHLGTLTWTVSANLPSRPVLLAVFALIALSSIAAVFIFHSLIAALLTALVLIASVIDSVLPVSYRLDYEKANVKIGPVEWLEMPWSDVKTVYKTPKGIKLSPFDNPESAALESVRGITLRCPPNMVEAVNLHIQSMALAK
jgi:hypothetical protein